MAVTRTRIRRRVRRRQAPRVRRAAAGGARAARQDARAQMQGEGALMIGGARDPAEKAADRMAAQVMAGGVHAGATSAAAAPAGAVHRACAACAGGGGKCPACAENDERDPKNVARSAKPGAVTASGTGAAPASAGAAKAIGAMGSGRPLGRAERAFFEPRFGRDFSGVRVHDGLAADRAARAVDARAFAHGRDIAFARGERERGGKALMAHELAHVAAEGGTARRKVRRLGDLSQVPPGMGCPVPNSSVAMHAVSRIQFGLGGATLSPDAQRDLSTVARGFHAMGRGFNFRVDGFASTDGPDSINWPLSCRRAEAVRNELARPSDGTPGVPLANLTTFAQGETTEFGRSLPANRVATVRSDVVFAPFSCAHGNPETQATACVQPVLIADDDGSSPTSAPSFRTVQDAWGRCCLDVSVNASVTVNGSRYKDIDNAENLVPTQEERDMIRDAGVGTNCVPVFVVDTISLSGRSGKNVSGGGYTLTSGLAVPHIVVVDGGSSWLVAHELGHAFDVHHDRGTRADGQQTIAQPTGSFSVAGTENVSDPICTAARASGPVTAAGGTPTCCKDLS